MSDETLGAVIDVTQAHLIVLRDHWYGMSEHAPLLAVHELHADKTGAFNGEGWFQTASSDRRTVTVKISKLAASRFLAQLANAAIEPGAYTPTLTHTDDMPALEIALHVDSTARGGMVLLFTTSQGDTHAPWGARIDGKEYTLPGDEVGLALRAIHKPLRFEILDEMMESPGAGASFPHLSADQQEEVVFEALWLQGAAGYKSCDRAGGRADRRACGRGDRGGDRAHGSARQAR